MGFTLGIIQVAIWAILPILKAEDLSTEYFTKKEPRHCSAVSIDRIGSIGNDQEACALMCLMYEDCEVFMWSPQHTNDCFLRAGCTIAIHSFAVLFIKMSEALSIKWKSASVPPGMSKYENKKGTILDK